MYKVDGIPWCINKNNIEYSSKNVPNLFHAFLHTQFIETVQDPQPQN